MSEPLIRSFTHLTIPAEIWLRRDLSIQSKALWAELRSLHDKEAGGCYASDDYLMEFLNLKRSRLYEIYKELKEKKLLEIVSFDGRKTVRRAIVPEVEYTTGNQVSGKPDTINPENRTPSIRKTGFSPYIENKEENKEKKRTPSPDAMGVCIFLFDHLKKKNPGHKPPNLNAWAKEMESFMRKDNRSAEDLKKVISWAMSQDDDFWATAIQSPKTLRNLFDRARIKMNHKSKAQKQKDEEEESLSREANNKALFRKLLPKIHKKVPHEGYQENVSENYIQFVNYQTSNRSEKIYFKDSKFKQLIEHELKKRGYLK